MDRAIIQAQLLALEAQLALAPAGTAQWEMIQSQIQVLTNELSYEPVAPPIWGPGPGGGGHGGGGHGHGR